MKRLIVSLLLCSHLSASGQAVPADLRIEFLKNPVGLDVTRPHFSWKMKDDRRNSRQTAYELEVYLDGRSAPVWKSGRQASDQSAYVPYGGPALQSDTRYRWRVRIWDHQQKASAWSADQFWQTGLQASEWKADWIEPTGLDDPIKRPSPLFRKTFTSRKKIRQATLYITSHGMYEAWLNGQRVGDAYLTPGWTSYHNRLQYQAYDVTAQVQTGSNVLGVRVGNGWYSGYIGFTGNHGFYGKDIALLCQLQIRYTDGSTDLIKSDDSWTFTTADIRAAEIYFGETVDARLAKEGWTRADYAGNGWMPVKTAAHRKDVLIGTRNEMVKKQERFKPVNIFTTPKGELVADFGQNLVGWVKVRMKGRAGDTLRLQYAEVLDKFGNVYTENLRVFVQDTYVQKGGDETYEPTFTWHGFRYMKLEGYPGSPKAEDLEAVALYSDMDETGDFVCSNPLVNQLQKNIRWGQKGNFLDVPTDCPQRDERLGWTGDAQAFSRTAAFNMDVQAFFRKWLRDLEADQVKGSVPFVIPNVLKESISSAGWADAATIIPWNMYLAFGDRQVLQTQYGSMKAYVEHIRSQSRDDLWNQGFHFGDWLFYRPFDDNDGRAAVTDKYLIAQCFYAHSTELLVKAAEVLGYAEDVRAYRQLLGRIREAFQREYVTPSGRLVSSTQTAYVLALQFDMLPENLRAQAAARLADNVRSYGNHLTTGFLGTPYLSHVLTRFGYLDIAYTLLLQETYPSWLYPVKMGATTIWERWDGMKPDSTFQTPGMNSFNHYAYGAIGDWLYRVVAGLDTDPEAPGYKRLLIRPYPGGRLDHADARLETPYGQAGSSWKRGANGLQLTVRIPPNTRARIFLPTSQAEGVTESARALTQHPDLKWLGVIEGRVCVEAGAGLYVFDGIREIK